MNINIDCIDCDREFGPDSEDGWSFRNVPDNKLARDLIKIHTEKYGHHVKVVKVK